MEVDHIFIFSANQGKEAEELIDFGFTEGSSRVHPGQGTINRKFYFENFFLEILWVLNEDEIKSDLVSPTRLWERSNFKKNDVSPFGLCLVNTEDTDIIFKNSLKYQPDYFPKGLEIEVLTNEKANYLPWTFRLPFKGEKKKTTEPTIHKNEVSELTKVEFGIPFLNLNDEYILNFEDEDSINFSRNSTCHLTLIFDKNKRNKTKVFDTIPLTIKY
jgi:Glyoxalase-like domain